MMQAYTEEQRAELIEALEEAIKTETHSVYGHAARIALAALAAESVGWLIGLPGLYPTFTLDYRNVEQAIKAGDYEITPIYTAPPVAGLMLPKEVTRSDAPCHLSAEEADSWVDGAGWMRDEVQRLTPSEPDVFTSDYLKGHADGREWAAEVVVACHPETSDWMYDDPADLARVIRKGPAMPAPVVPDGWKLVPVEPTQEMVIEGFESEPDEDFSEPDEWEKYSQMSGCEQAAHRARRCWAAMLAAAPEAKINGISEPAEEKKQ